MLEPIHMFENEAIMNEAVLASGYSTAIANISSNDEFSKQTTLNYIEDNVNNNSFPEYVLSSTLPDSLPSHNPKHILEELTNVSPAKNVSSFMRQYSARKLNMRQVENLNSNSRNSSVASLPELDFNLRKKKKKKKQPGSLSRSRSMSKLRLHDGSMTKKTMGSRSVSKLMLQEIKEKNSGKSRSVSKLRQPDNF